MELVYELISYSCYAEMISQNYLMNQIVKKCQW